MVEQVVQRKSDQRDGIGREFNPVTIARCWQTARSFVTTSDLSDLCLFSGGQLSRGWHISLGATHTSDYDLSICPQVASSLVIGTFLSAPLTPLTMTSPSVPRWPALW